MKRPTKADVDRAYQNGYQTGVHHGYEKGRAEALAAAQAANKTELLAAQVKLLNAVGQTMDTQARLLQGLANTFDCGPRA